LRHPNGRHTRTITAHPLLTTLALLITIASHTQAQNTDIYITWTAVERNPCGDPCTWQDTCGYPPGIPFTSWGGDPTTGISGSIHYTNDGMSWDTSTEICYRRTSANYSNCGASYHVTSCNECINYYNCQTYGYTWDTESFDTWGHRWTFAPTVYVVCSDNTVRATFGSTTYCTLDPNNTHCEYDLLLNDGLGCHPEKPYHITIDIPKIQSPCVTWDTTTKPTVNHLMHGSATHNDRNTIQKDA
jgi:hypothetical protein